MDCRNSTPLHSPFQTMSHGSHHKYLLLYSGSVCFQLSSVQLVRPKAACKNFTYGSFVSTLRIYLASLGFDPKLFARNSFCRGGASFTYQAGVPIKLIKALGNWGSDTILSYLTMPLTICLHSANMLGKAILSHTPHHFHNTNPSTTSTSGFGP